MWALSWALRIGIVCGASVIILLLYQVVACSNCSGLLDSYILNETIIQPYETLLYGLRPRCFTLRVLGISDYFGLRVSGFGD